MAQSIQITADIIDAAARAKLAFIDKKVDELNTKSITIKTNAAGAQVGSVVKLGDAYGYTATVATRLNKQGQELVTITRQQKDATEQFGNASRRSLVGVMALSQAVYAAFYAVVGALRSALTEMKNVDTQLVDVRKVTDASAEELENFQKRAYEVGKAYGIVASDYLSAVAAMSRAGYREQAGDLAELSAKLQLVGNVSQDVANQLLISVDKAYKLEGDYMKLSKVIDQMNEIDNNFATSIERVAEGMGIIAPVASQAHMSIEELMAAIGTITATTQRSGSEAARALRSLVLNIVGDTKTEIEDGVSWTIDEINTLKDVLKKYAPEAVKAAQATGEVIDPMEAIGGLAQSYKDGLMKEQDLFAMVADIGGKLRSSQLMALIQNWDMYNQMLEMTGQAAGSADKEVANALDSWQVKINQLKNTFTEFVSKSLTSDFVKGLLDFVTKLVADLGSIGNVITIIGGAIIAMKLPALIGTISRIVTMVKLVGGGFGNLLLVMKNYGTLAPALAKSNGAMVASFNSMTAAEKSAQLATIGLSAALAALMIAITASIMLYNKHKQALEDTVAKGITAIAELNRVDDLAKKYNELKDAYEQGNITAQEFADGRTEVISSLQDEGVWVDSVTGKYESLDEKIQAAIDKSKEYKKIEIDDSIEALDSMAYEAHQKINTDYISQLLGIYSWSGDWGEDVKNISFLAALYEKAVERRTELYESGQYGSSEDKWLQYYIDSVQEIYDNYVKLNNAKEEYNSDSSGEDKVKSVTDETTKSVKSLSDELENATKALDKYKKALEGGEKGDAFKSYAEAYKNAIELKEKGLTGSNAFMSAIDLLIPHDVMRELHYNYEKAGELLGNDFFKAMFEGGGEDFGVNAANYIREHIGEFEGVEVTEAEGKFALLVRDVEAFAKSAKMSTDTAYALLGALDMLGSTATYTNEQFDDLFNTYAKGIISIDENGKRTLPLTEFINNLAAGGKTEREIYQIVDAVKHLAETDSTFEIVEPESIDETIKKIVELHETAQEDNNVEVVIGADTSEFDGAWAGIKKLDGTSITIGIKVKRTSPIEDFDVNHQVRGRYTEYATGTKSAQGGTALVNEEGAEIIYANGSAWVAGGGQPTITNLPIGARVFNADQTREIFSRSGINSFESTPWIPIPPSKDILGGKKLTKNIEKILDELSKYIDDILKKAKKALDKQLKAIDEQIEALEKEHNAEEEKNKLEELRLNILEAEKKLAEAQNERTVRYFNKETGQWEWMADQKAVHEAEQALKEAQEAYDKEVAEQEYQAKLQELKDQKEALQKQYDDLAEHWEEILEAIQEAGKEDVDFEEILKKLGLSGEVTDDIRKLIEAILDYEKQLTDGTFQTPLDSDTANKIMGGIVGSGTGGDTLTKLIGLSGGDMNAKGASIYNSNITNTTGDVNYYINGLQIGSDMMDRPLSEILSRLSIYAN